MVWNGSATAEIALIENILRQNLSPIEEARALQRLKDQKGCTDACLAEELGFSRTYVTEMLSLNRLPARIQEECRTSDIIPKSLLVQLVAVRDEEKMLEIFDRAKSEQLTVSGIREARKKDGHRGRPKNFKYARKRHDYDVLLRHHSPKANLRSVRDALQAELDEIDEMLERADLEREMRSACAHDEDS